MIALLKTAARSPKLQWLCRGLFLAALAVVAWFSLQAPTGGVSWFPHSDKLQHAIAYGVIAGLCALGWPRVRRRYIWAIAALFGLLIEYGQGSMGLGRDASLWDALANAAGAALALYIVSRVLPRA